MVVLKKAPTQLTTHDLQSHSGHPTMASQTPYRDDPESAQAEPSPPAYQPDLEAMYSPRRKPRRALYKFVGALLIAAMIIAFAGHLRSSSRLPDGSPEKVTYPGEPAHLPVHEGHPVSQAKWSSPVNVPHREGDHGIEGGSLPWYSSVSNFTLPYSSDTLSLFLHMAKEGRGDSLVTTTTDPSLSNKDEVKINVETFFHFPSVRDALWVGELARDGGRSKGVGIFGGDAYLKDPEHRWIIDTYVQIVLPPKHVEGLYGKSPNPLPQFEVNTSAASVKWQVTKDSPSVTPRSIVVASSSGSIQFDYIEATDMVLLASSSGSIRGLDGASEISADKVTLKGGSGSIGGSFRVIDSLNLVTSSGSIKAQVYLPGKKGDGSLQYNFASKGGEEFEQSSPNVVAQTSSGSIRLDYLEQNPSVELHSQVGTSSGSTEVNHDDNYQGTFSISTSSGSIHWTASEGKERQVDQEHNLPSFRHVEGKVWFGKEDGWSKNGSSVIRTSSGSVRAAL